MELEGIRDGTTVTKGNKDTPKSVLEKLILNPINDTTELANLLLMKCCGCNEPYNECDKIPKSLTCGHSLCNKCVGMDTHLLPRCPECLSVYRATDAKNFPINYLLLRIIRYVLKEKSSQKNIVDKVIIPSPIPPSDLKDDFWRCPAHDSPTAFLCISCSMWACRDCLVVDHPCLPRGSCRVLSLSKAIESIRENHCKQANAVFGKINLIKDNLEPEVDCFNFLVKHCLSIERNHRRIQHDINIMMGELKEIDESLVNTSILLIKKSLNDMKTTTSLKEITALCKGLADCQQNVEKYIAQEKDRKKLLKQDISMHLRMDLKLLIEGGGKVFAVRRETRSRFRWAQVSSLYNHLTVSSLREGEPPEGSLNIQYEYVRDMVHKNNPTVFFDIGTTDISHGSVYIRLSQDCPRVRKFVTFCSGEKEDCYKGTSFFNMECNKKFIYGGDLENNDGTGSNTTLDYYDLVWPKVKGKFNGKYCLIPSYCSFSKFGFTQVSGSDQNVMGKVTKGSDIIKSLCDNETVSGIVVRECGFVIPGELEECEASGR